MGTHLQSAQQDEDTDDPSASMAATLRAYGVEHDPWDGYEPDPHVRMICRALIALARLELAEKNRPRTESNATSGADSHGS